METLFYSLLTTQKVKRWVIILDQLEEKSFTGNELAQILGCTSRTIISDIKQIKKSFGTTLVLLGDDNGYFLELKNPRDYYQKKQAIIEKEPLFQMIDIMFENKNWSSSEWAEELKLSIATFTRLKRQLNKMLKNKYGLNFSSKKNQLQGQETRIRQYFFDFYFTIPFYPSGLSDRIQNLRKCVKPIFQSKWQLNSVALQGWIMISETRINQGYTLVDPERNDLDICQKLADALDPTHKLELPQQEKACLFLAALEEKQFISPLVQTEFIYQFSSASWGSLLDMEEEQKHVQLFKTLINLMKEYFHLPYELLKLIEDGEEFYSTELESKLLSHLMMHFLKEKQKMESAISVRYRLIGSQALQRWIKSEVRSQLEQKGYLLYEEEKVASGCNMPYIQVTNNYDCSVIRQSDICLSAIPEREEIADTFNSYNKLI